jgi:hypothetical protein
VKYYLALQERLNKEAAPGTPGAARGPNRTRSSLSVRERSKAGLLQEPRKPREPPSPHPSGSFPGFQGLRDASLSRIESRPPPNNPPFRPTFLFSPSAPEPLDALWQAEMALWSEELKEEWCERAAIREYEGNLDRAAAERSAFEDIASRLVTAPPMPDELEIEPVDRWDRIERWLRLHGFSEVDPAELDSYKRFDWPIAPAEQGQEPWRCQNRDCLHKVGWWKPVCSVINCLNCQPPALPSLVIEIGTSGTSHQARSV